MGDQEKKRDDQKDQKEDHEEKKDDNDENGKSKDDSIKEINMINDSSKQKDEKKEPEIKKTKMKPSNKQLNLTKPWLTYAYAVCQGLQNQLNNTEEMMTSIQLDQNLTENTIKQLRENEKEVMNKVLKELNSLTKKAMNKEVMEQNCLKPNKIKESIKSRLKKKKSGNQLIDKTDSNEADSNKADSNKVESNKIESNKSESNKAPFNLKQSNDQQKNQQTDNQEANLNDNHQTNQLPAIPQIDTNTQVRNVNIDILSNIIKNEFKCSICQELIVNATNLNCSHTFCKICIDEWLDLNNKKCPVCRTLILSNNRFRCLPIDNFLALYFSNFTTEEQQADRTRLIGEHRSREVIVINDDATAIQPREQRLDNFFDSIEFFSIEEPRTRRNRARNRFGLRNFRTNNNNSTTNNARLNRQRSNRGNQFSHASRRRATPMTRTIQQTQTDSSSLEVLPPSELRNNIDDEQMLEHYPALAFEINMIESDNSESNEPISLNTDLTNPIHELGSDLNNSINELRTNSVNELTIISPPIRSTNRISSHHRRPELTSIRTRARRLRSLSRSNRSNRSTIERGQSNSRPLNNETNSTSNRETVTSNSDNSTSRRRQRRTGVERPRRTVPERPRRRENRLISTEPETRRLNREERRRARRLRRLNVSDYILDRENC